MFGFGKRNDNPDVMAARGPTSGTAGGRTGPAVGKEKIREAIQTLQEYKRGKANLESRIIENMEWYKLRHWELLRRQTDDRPEPVSAWLFNSLANKHADAMDNYPEPNVLPREESDKEDAKQLSAILPVVLEENEYEQVYSDKWWYKLISGTSVEAVLWNPQKQGGLGDIEVRQVDLLNIFWEPGVRDIQRSRNIFTVELVDTDLLRQRYPQADLEDGRGLIDVARYAHDESIDTTKKSLIVDWYYKRQEGARTVLHYCKFVGTTVLYASEDDETYKTRGFYDHGEYPFVFDTLFIEDGSPAGFGYVDVMKSPQLYIDKLNQLLLSNAMIAGRTRYFVRRDGSVDPKVFSDLSVDLIPVEGNDLGENSIREINVQPLGSQFTNLLQMKIDELKETSGNRDFSQGGTTSGVTAASAIAALQEAGSKLSRDMIKSAYRSFTRVCYFCIELIRQFYDAPRCFRVTGEDGSTQFVAYDNARIRPQAQGEAFGVQLGARVPVFDIKVRAQKSNPFSKIAQNELAKEFYGMGFFNPAMSDQALACMDMMDFEGKDMVMQRVAQNGTLYQMVQQLQQQMLQMAAIIDRQNGTTLSQGLLATGGVSSESPAGASGGSSGVETNPLGEAYASATGNTAETAALRASRNATPS